MIAARRGLGHQVLPGARYSQRRDPRTARTIRRVESVRAIAEYVAERPHHVEVLRWKAGYARPDLREPGDANEYARAIADLRRLGALDEDAAITLVGRTAMALMRRVGAEGDGR